MATTNRKILRRDAIEAVRAKPPAVVHPVYSDAIRRDELELAALWHERVRRYRSKGVQGRKQVERDAKKLEELIDG